MPPPYGIIVLGGAIDDDISARARPDDFRRRRGAPDRGGDPRAALSRGADRLHRRQRLAARSSVERGGRRAQPARRDRRRRRSASRSRTRSRNTDENARFTAALVHPESGSDLAASSPPPITCRARWGCSARRVSRRSPIPSTIAREGGARDWRLNVRSAARPRAVRPRRRTNGSASLAYRLSGRIDDVVSRPVSALLDPSARRDDRRRGSRGDRRACPCGR